MDALEKKDKSYGLKMKVIRFKMLVKLPSSLLANDYIVNTKTVQHLKY